MSLRRLITQMTRQKPFFSISFVEAAPRDFQASAPKGMTSSVRSSAQGKRKSRISSKISLMSLAMIRRMTFPTSQGTSSGFF